MAVLGPAAHQHAYGGACAGERDEYGVRGAFGEDQFGDRAHRQGEAVGGLVQGGVEQLLVLLARLVLHRQRLRVVGSAALDGLLALLGRRLQGHVREVLEQPADLFRGVRGEGGAAEGVGEHGGPFGDVRGDHREDYVRGVFGEPRQQAVRGVQFGGVCGVVDHGDDRVETGAGDVVGVAVARAVRGGVVGGEGEAASYRVPGVVHGEDG